MGSFDELFQKSSLGESFHAAKSSRVASHHRGNFSSATAEVLDRVDFVGEFALFFRKWADGGVDFVEVGEEF